MVGSKIQGAASKEISGLTAATTSLAFGGNAKSITRSSKTAISAHEYNRELHDDERTVANALKQGKTPEEQLIIDGAASAAVKLNRSVPGSDEYYEAVQTLVDIGKAHPEVQAQLRAKAREMGYKDAFVYSTRDASMDKVARNDEGIERSVGVIKAGLGSKWSKASARGAVTLAQTGTPWGYVGAGLLSAATIGNAYYTGSAASDAVGQYRSREGARVLESLHNPVKSYAVEKGTKIGVDLAVAFMGSVGAGTISAHVTRNGALASTNGLGKSFGGAMLGSKDAGKRNAVSARKPSSLDNPLLKEPRVSSGTLKFEAGAKPKTIAAQAKYPEAKMKVDGAKALKPDQAKTASASQKEVVQKGEKGDNSKAQEIRKPVESGTADAAKFTTKRNKFGKITGVEFTQKHHKVPQSLNEHELFDRAGMHVNDRANIIILPTKKGAKYTTTERVVHEGKHTNEVTREIKESMDAVLNKGIKENWTEAQFNEGLRNIMQNERKGLKAGTRILNGAEDVRKTGVTK